MRTFAFTKKSLSAQGRRGEEPGAFAPGCSAAAVVDEEEVARPRGVRDDLAPARLQPQEGRSRVLDPEVRPARPGLPNDSCGELGVGIAILNLSLHRFAAAGKAGRISGGPHWRANGPAHAGTSRSSTTAVEGTAADEVQDSPLKLKIT